MNSSTRLTLAALAAFVLEAAPAAAAVRPEPSPLALPSPGLAQMLSARVPEAGGPQSPETPLTLALAQVPGRAPVEFSGVHYRPRSGGRYGRQPESAGVSQKIGRAHV